jgi:uncharacterized protein (DUF1800 family)
MRRRAALVGLTLVLVAAHAAAGAGHAAAGAVHVAAGALPPGGDDARALHVLRRLTYGPRPGDAEAIRAMGVDAWLERQLAPDSIDDRAADQALTQLRTLALAIPDLQREYPRPPADLRARVDRGEMTREQLLEQHPRARRPARIVEELAAARAIRAVASERQVQELMVDFWFNHFNVSFRKGDVRWFVTAYERDVIRPHELGRFPDLLRATARHPAMLYYLDNWLSVREGFTPLFGSRAGRRGGLNENYARELLELHTLGVDGGYTQRDVREVARAFSGWTIDRQGGGRVLFRPRQHDDGPKVVLGATLPAGGGDEDAARVLDLLARHPATARFVATKLARRFVSDDPPPALVERVAATYARTGGDIRAMLRTLVASPEFAAPEARRAKVKRPLEFVASAVRAVGGTVDAQGGVALAQAAAEMGEALYLCEAPTGYPDRGEAWVTAGTLLARMNFGLALAQGRLTGVRVDLDRTDPGIPRDPLPRLLASPLGDGLGPATRAALAASLGRGAPAAPLGRGALAAPLGRRQDMPLAGDHGPRSGPEPRGEYEALVALAVGAPEFQRR